MELTCEVKPKGADQRKKIDIPFRAGERERFERYLEETGTKAGPLVRILIIRQMDRERPE